MYFWDDALFPDSAVLMEPENSSHRLRVSNHAPRYHPQCSLKREEFHFDDLIFLWVGSSGAKLLGEVYGHGFGHKAGAHVEMQHAAPAFRGVSGFFAQFAFGGHQCVFAFVDSAGTEFPQILLGRMTILPDQEDPWLASGFVHSKDYDRTGVADDVAANFNAARFNDLVVGDPECRSPVNFARRDYASFVAC